MLTCMTNTTTWDPVTRVLRTTLAGTVGVTEVQAWREGLLDTLSAVPDGAEILLLSDLHGYEPADIAAHQAMRAEVPSLLLRHGMRPAVFDLFDDAPTAPPTIERGVRVVAFANVHHDGAKMEEYDRRVGKPDQRFFANRAAAERWLGEGPWGSLRG
jgi:hypothetical protein